MTTYAINPRELAKQMQQRENQRAHAEVMYRLFVKGAAEVIDTLPLDSLDACKRQHLERIRRACVGHFAPQEDY